MSTRSAEATIKGYYYQFNKTIESLLDLINADDCVVIEGIEDIDITTISGIEYVQCKYYSALKLTNSAVREPLMLMLDHYVKIKATKRLNYILFGYYKDESVERVVKYSLDELKNILTFKENGIEKKHHLEKKISDELLSNFLKVFRIEVSREFELHQNGIADKLKKHFQCSEFVAHNFYLNNGLRIILDRAIKSSISDRTISKKTFLKEIDCSKTLFFSWFKKYKNQKDYLLEVKNQIKSTRLLSLGKEKMLVLGKHIDFSSQAMPLAAFIQEAADLFFKVSKSPISSKPLTIVIDCDEKKILEVKKVLIGNRVKFNDGLEGYQFCPFIFCEDAIVNKKGNGQIISKASFQVRLLSRTTLQANYSNMSKTFSILYVAEDPLDIPQNFYSQLLEVKYVDQLPEIINLIKN